MTVSPTVSENWLQRALAIFTMALMLATAPLWLLGPDQLVQIPWWSFLCDVPGWVDHLALGAVCFGCVTKLIGRGSLNLRWSGDLAYVLGLGVLISLDQHRMQPWAWQFLIVGLLTVISPPKLLFPCWRWVIVSIYFWSAISKFDASFMNSHGQLLLNGMLEPLGVDTAFWSEESRRRLAGLFPVGELLTALLLLPRQTRPFGLAASIVMHLLLIWTLGYGLKHEWGVVLWNLFFIVQNLLVFGPASWKPASRPVLPASLSFGESRQARSTIMYTIIVIFYPFLETGGYCDHWPAWAVYCSRPAQVKILIPEEDAQQLPEELRRFLGSPEPLDDRVPLNLDAWSYARTHAPVYPQLRYRLFLAHALLAPHLPNAAITVQAALTPDRQTGDRTLLRLHGMQTLRHECRNFHVNHRPRGPSAEQ